MEICYWCLDPLRRVSAREQVCRALSIGKKTYIAEFHFCEANCVPFLERVFPTIECKERTVAVEATAKTPGRPNFGKQCQRSAVQGPRDCCRFG